ncbi:hypothetical protein [Neoaquamicrobium sediminum]|uniref:hypothetical protein n=1 Tax=Neoaquamicrobium sediminum TaxID=1849104 RepID=UPI0036071C4A
MNIDLITIREAELKAELTRLRESIDAVEKELDELTIAKGVFLRLTGKAKAPASTSAPKRAKFPRPAQKKPEELPTIRNLVFEALMDARQRGLPGLAPRQIREYVAQRYNYEMGSSANTVPSRMWRTEKAIQKDTETGLFSLPSKEKPADENSLAGTSAGLFEAPAKGREAGPGGGT